MPGAWGPGSIFEGARTVSSPCGRVLVQFRLATGLTSEEYVNRQEWQHASLLHCPFHPKGGCGFRRHGTYPRKYPAGARVPRWYCPTAHATVSLLADCFAAKLPGSLASLERVVAEAERPGTQEAVAMQIRPELEPAGALRWTRRRVRAVHAGLRAAIGLLPVLLAGCLPDILSVRAALGVEFALPVLREKAGPHLSLLPPPLGFGPRPQRRRPRPSSVQHDPGPDPPT